MNVELIVGEIDAEIEKLERIRAILEGLCVSKSRTPKKPRVARSNRLPQIELEPEPLVTVLPPRQRREYIRRAKPMSIERKALAAPLSNLPVFVPRAAVQHLQPAKATDDGNGMEALMRRKLLGGAA